MACPSVYPSVCPSICLTVNILLVNTISLQNMGHIGPKLVPWMGNARVSLVKFEDRWTRDLFLRSAGVNLNMTRVDFSTWDHDNLTNSSRIDAQTDTMDVAHECLG